MSAKGTRKPGGRSPPRKAVLVVDDEVGTVDVLVAVLGDAGYDVVGAYDGKQALVEAREKDFALVLLDLVMPGTDGSETLRELRRDPRMRAVPVVMMSGIPESMVARKARGYGAFLRKPFSLDELVATVDKMVRARR